MGMIGYIVLLALKLHARIEISRIKMHKIMLCGPLTQSFHPSEESQ